jgi:hypothetical protein
VSIGKDIDQLAEVVHHLRELEVLSSCQSGGVQVVLVELDASGVSTSTGGGAPCNSATSVKLGIV